MTRTILAIDPGPKESAWMLFRDGKPLRFGKELNDAVMDHIIDNVWRLNTDLVIEQVKSYGMAVGEEVFETVFWSGRFAQASGLKFYRIGRQDVKSHLCRSMRAKDTNIRQALIDRYGGKAEAIGTKKRPGPLYGISGDCWAALAVAVTWAETKGDA